MLDKTGWNWLVLLTLAVVVLGVCFWIFMSLVARWSHGGAQL